MGKWLRIAVWWGLGGGGLEITRNGGKPLFVGVIRGRGGGQKAQPLCGKSSKLGGCLEAGGGRCRKMEGRRRKTAIYGTFKGAGKRKKKKGKLGKMVGRRKKKRASLEIPARL